MPPFKLSKKSKDDLVGIARYTEKIWGREQRWLYLKKLDSIFYTVAENHELGSPCDDVRAGYIKKQVGCDLIFYRFDTSSKIEIIRVLHKRIDVALHL